MSTPGDSLFAELATGRSHAAHAFQIDDRPLVKRWRPVSFSKFALMSTTIVIVAFLASVVAIHIQNKRTGAIISTSLENDIGNAQNFMYQYLPTILIVVFGIWISVVDLDVKRLNPWSRLSSGLSGSSSALFCLYDTDFVLTVIYKSFCAGHWPVLISSVLMILVTIIIPAVQTAIFTTTTKLILHRLTIGAPQDTVDATTQMHTMTNNFLVTAYSIAWLGQSQPPFTTNSYTVAPFNHSMVRNSAQTYVVAATAKYWAEVNCWKPDAAIVNTTSNRISFKDGKGCETKDVFDDDTYWNTVHSQYMALHIPVDSPEFAFKNLHALETTVTSMCPNFPNRFLSIWWVSGSNPDFNGRGQGLALFCDVTYYKESGMAKVLLSNDSVVSFNALGPREVLNQKDFNSTQFQRITIDGHPPNLYAQNGGHDQVTLDVNEGTSVGTRHTRNFNVHIPAYTTEGSYIVSWLFALAPAPLDRYLDSMTLAESYERTYQQLFALAMSQNFASGSSKPLQDVEAEFLAHTVTLVPGFLYATEALLATALLLCSWLGWQVSRRRLVLIRNPDCLAQVMDLARSPAVQAKFMSYSNSTESNMKRHLGADAFRVAMSSDGRPALHVTGALSTSSPAQTDNSAIDHPVAKHVPEVSWIVLGPTIISIAVVITTLYVLNRLSTRNHGIPLPMGNDFTVQLALSFAPTVLATLLGYYICAVCRASSFMKPLQDLRKGHAGAMSTLLTTYTSLPPVILFPNAFRAGHFLLAILSILSLVSNVLTVSMAGLFTLYIAPVASTMNITASKEPFLSLMKDSDSRYIVDHQEDPIYTVTANFSGLTKLPTWTTTKYGYLPISFAAMATSIQSPELEYETIGYGADLDCVDFLTIHPDQSAHFELINFRNESALSFEFCYDFPEGDAIPCSIEDNLHWGTDTYLAQVPDNQVAAYEVQATVSRPNGPKENPVWNSQTNEQQIVLAWLRGRWKTKVASFPNGFYSTSGSNPYFEYNATVIACRPRLKVQKAVIRTDTEGNVVSEILQGSPDYSIEGRLNLTNTLRATIQAVAGKEPYTTIGWHTNIIAQDWPNYVYKSILNNTDMIDPEKPVPTVEFASKIASQAFSRIFAAQLALDRQYLGPTSASSSNSQSATLHHVVRRFRLSYPMFIITQTILTLDLLVLLSYRIMLPEPFLPRRPFTIASQIAYAAASHVIDDVAAAVERTGNYTSSSVLQKQLEAYRFGYGRHLGKDGKPHIGVERDPFVQKLR